MEHMIHDTAKPLLGKKFHFYGLVFDTNKEAADFFGVTQTHMSNVFNGSREPSSRMLQMAGYERIQTVSIRKIEGNP